MGAVGMERRDFVLPLLVGILLLLGGVLWLRAVHPVDPAPDERASAPAARVSEADGGATGAVRKEVADASVGSVLRITDEEGRSLPDAWMPLVNAAGGASLLTRSDSHGTIRLSAGEWLAGGRDRLALSEPEVVIPASNIVAFRCVNEPRPDTNIDILNLGSDLGRSSDVARDVEGGSARAVVGSGGLIIGGGNDEWRLPPTFVPMGKRRECGFVLLPSSPWARAHLRVGGLESVDPQEVTAHVQYLRSDGSAFAGWFCVPPLEPGRWLIEGNAGLACIVQIRIEGEVALQFLAGTLQSGIQIGYDFSFAEVTGHVARSEVGRIGRVLVERRSAELDASGDWVIEHVATGMQRVRVLSRKNNTLYAGVHEIRAPSTDVGLIELCHEVDIDVLVENACSRRVSVELRDIGARRVTAVRQVEAGARRIVKFVALVGSEVLRDRENPTALAVDSGRKGRTLHTGNDRNANHQSAAVAGISGVDCGVASCAPSAARFRNATRHRVVRPGRIGRAAHSAASRGGREVFRSAFARGVSRAYRRSGFGRALRGKTSCRRDGRLEGVS